MEDYCKADTAAATELGDFLAGRLPAGWDAQIPSFPADVKGLASRVSSGKVIAAVSAGVPWFLGARLTWRPPP